MYCINDSLIIDKFFFKIIRIIKKCYINDVRIKNLYCVLKRYMNF